VTVPDGVDPIVGWRYWKVTPGGLASLNVRGSYWPPREAYEAECRAAPIPMPHSADDLPSESCACGIYAACDLETLKRLVYPFADALFRQRRIAVGEVRLWGRVISGSRGYRAQRAYPKSLYLVSRKQDEPWVRFSEVALEGAYGVPVRVLDKDVAVGTNTDVKALFGLVGVASAIAVGVIGARAAAQRARFGETLSGDGPVVAGGGPGDATPQRGRASRPAGYRTIDQKIT
jgi:hypothetical protein